MSVFSGRTWVEQECPTYGRYGSDGIVWQQITVRLPIRICETVRASVGNCYDPNVPSYSCLRDRRLLIAANCLHWLPGMNRPYERWIPPYLIVTPNFPLARPLPVLGD